MSEMHIEKDLIWWLKYLELFEIEVILSKPQDNKFVKYQRLFNAFTTNTLNCVGN